MTPLVPPDPALSDGVVTLRAFDAADADALAVLMDDEEMSQWTRTPWPYRRSDAVEWIASHPGKRERSEALLLAIVDAASGELLGSTGVRMADDGRAEIGYLVARWARRRGVATRALRLCARHALETLGLARVEVLVQTANVRSLGVAERTGFTREGVLRSHTSFRDGRRDMVIFSLLPGELGE